MKHKVKPIKQEGGITLIALIITIIVLVILAAVTLNSLFGNNIIGIAVNGAINYSEEQQKELGMLNDVSDMLGDITGDTDRPMSPSITLNGTKGNNDIYTSNVSVTISINKGFDQTGTIKLHYQINGGEEQVTEEDVSFEVSTEGTTTITAWTENERGNISDKKDTSFTINKTAPSNPTISLNGDIGDNNYYKSNVGVTINAGDASNVASIRYKVEGANPIAETEVQGTTANFDITADGTSTTTAYIINTAGLTSETITQVVNKDTTEPSTATIVVSGETGETSINVTATGADTTSGVASYIFQYSTTSETDGFTTALEVPNTTNSCTFEYQGLASNTTYYLRVIVKDRAGNTTPSTAVNATTKKAGLSDTELASNIGKYVNYKPVNGTFSDHVEESYAGDFASFNSTMSTETYLKWRILFVDEEKLTLISDNTANEGFYLDGANGYNNGVLLLNNACKAMYSNSSLGAVGRNVKIEDIEKVSSFNPEDDEFLNYGKEVTNSMGKNNVSYPNIFAKELNGAPNGTYGTELDLSEQDEYITGTSRGNSSFKGREMYYSYMMTLFVENSSYMDDIYLELLGDVSDNTLPKDYWLASRCITGDAGETSLYFYIFYVDYYKVDADCLYESNYTGENSSHSLRPIVEIDLSKVNIGLTGNGGVNTPYSIEAK